MKLLTVGNPKTAKGETLGYWTAVLHFAPGSLSGRNVCAMATAGCLAACLNTAGRGGMMAGVSRLTLAMVQAGITNTIQRARVARTNAYFENRASFMSTLVAEIRAFAKRAARKGFKPAIRLNGTSDIPWERVPVTLDGVTYPNIMAVFPELPFYDYTKFANRKHLPANYSLTFSLAENNEANARRALSRGMNVAVVFRSKHAIPAEYLDTRTIDGDATDLRFLDPRGVVVALYAKGNARNDASGFVKL